MPEDSTVQTLQSMFLYLQLVLYWARPEVLKPWLQALSRPGQAAPLWQAYKGPGPGLGCIEARGHGLSPGFVANSDKLYTVNVSHIWKVHTAGENLIPPHYRPTMQAILSNNEVLVQPVQPRHIAKLLSRLTDPNNDATPKLCSHKALTASTTTNPAISVHSGKCAVDGHAVVNDLDLQLNHADDEGTNTLGGNKTHGMSFHYFFRSICTHRFVPTILSIVKRLHRGTIMLDLDLDHADNAGTQTSGIKNKGVFSRPFP